VRGKENMQYFVLLGRILYSSIFILSALFGHFSNETINYAAHHGVPMASVLVPLSGILSLLGVLSILLGYKARYGAWLIALFLIPVTLMMHKFWAADPGTFKNEYIMFMKNLSLLGAAFLIAYFGSGPLSLDRDRLRERV
jgi:putative oxidoreductase